MKRTMIMAAVSLFSVAVAAAEPWRFKAGNREMRIFIEADLYEESVDVPGMDWFGPLNGFVSGNGLYGVWAITSVKKMNDKEALVHFSNDLGSETQAVRLTWQNDSTLFLEQKGGTTFKRVEGKKLVKLPGSFTLKRQ